MVLHNGNSPTAISEHDPMIGCHVLRAILDLVTIDSISVQRILAEERILVKDVYEVSRRIKLRSYLRILDRLADLTRDKLFGLNMSQQMGPDMVGAVGYIFMSSPNLQVAFEKFSEHAGDIQDVTELGAKPAADNGLQILYNFTDESIFPRCQDVEFSLGYICALARQYLGGNFAPLEVRFEHEAQAPISYYEKLFGCDVFFEQDQNVLLVGANDLGRQCDRFDPNLIPILEDYLKYTVNNVELAESYINMTENVIQQLIHNEGVVSAQNVASRLGLTEVQLRARLKTEESCFKDLLLKKRMEQAKRLLLDSRLSILEIAHKCSYAETASFTRAFSAYMNQPPSRFRKENRGESREF